MIKIKIKDKDEFTENFYNKIRDYINQTNTKYSLENINCDLLILFDMDFEQIVKAEPHELRKLIEISPDEFSQEIVMLKDLYEVFRNKWSVGFLQALSLDVCPYCNREYIFKFEDTKKNEARIIASLDHYYDKDSYPFLSISLFNLIPACHNCNSKFKHTKDFYQDKHLHPYEDDFNTRAKFEYTINDNNSQYSFFSKERIALGLRPLNQDDISTQKTIDTFRLEDLYQNHKDIVLELIQKREIYPDSYIDELVQKYEGTLFNNREDILRLITCGYVNDEDIHKRPLSKLIKDISEELELI